MILCTPSAFCCSGFSALCAARFFAVLRLWVRISAIINACGEAVENGQEVLTLLVETFEQEGKPLPQPARQRLALAQVYL